MTLDGDPQMIWENPDGRAVRTLRVEASYSDEPREVCLYYTNRAGEDFSQDKRVFPQKQADGSYRYTLPYGAIASLRLDPCSPDVNKSIAITLGAVTMNEPAGAGSYFVPSWYQCFCFNLSKKLHKNPEKSQIVYQLCPKMRYNKGMTQDARRGGPGRSTSTRKKVCTYGELYSPVCAQFPGQ